MMRLHDSILSIECAEGKYQVNELIPPPKNGGPQDPLTVQVIITDDMLDGDEVVEFFRVLCTLPKDHEFTRVKGIGVIIDKRASEILSVYRMAPLEEMAAAAKQYYSDEEEEEEGDGGTEQQQPVAGGTEQPVAGGS